MGMAHARACPGRETPVFRREIVNGSVVVGAVPEVERLYHVLRPLVARGLGGEYMTTVLGLHSAAETTAFARSETFADALVLVSSHMDESLVVLRRALGWRPEDVLHLDVHVACEDQVRWDGRRVACVDRDLLDAPEALRVEMASLHANDRILYAAARVAVADRFRELGDSGDREVADLRRRKAALAARCGRGGPSAIYRPDADIFASDDPCVPFLMNDASFPIYLEKPRPFYAFTDDGFVDPTTGAILPIPENGSVWRSIEDVLLAKGEAPKKPKRANGKAPQTPADRAARVAKRRDAAARRRASSVSSADDDAPRWKKHQDGRNGASPR